MIALKITRIDGYEYTLEDDKNNTYVKNIEFMDEDVNISDILLVPASFLNEKVPLVYGTEITMVKEDDLIGLKTKDKKIILQRYYG